MKNFRNFNDVQAEPSVLHLKSFLMKNYIYLILLSLLTTPANLKAQNQKLPQLGEDPLSEVIAAMTNEEKAHMLTGTGMPGYAGLTPNANQKVRVPGAAGGTFPIERLGIPATVVADGPAGLRIQPLRENDSKTYYATAFPVGTALSSSWNVDLVAAVGKAMGNEVKEYGVDVLLAPALNIHRNPLNGRNFEYFSEDPLLTGEIAAAYVNGVESNGVGTSIKHFAANNQETNRLTLNARISERAMREIYLRGFEIAVKKAQPWTVMSAYNKINNTYASAREDLLTDILREEWGFDGYVMTDWFGGYAGFQSIMSDEGSDVVAQIKAGNDLLMPGTEVQRRKILEAIENGSLSEDVVNRSIARILDIVMKSPTFKKESYNNTPNLEHNAQVARQAATEGIILLKNDNNILPYTKKDSPLAIFGTTSYNFISGGTGSGDVNEAYTVSLIDGLKDTGFRVDEELERLYNPYVQAEAEKEAARREKEGGLLATPKRIAELEVPRELISKKAKSSDLAIITIGRNSGENADRILKDDFYLAQDEIELINRVKEAFHAEGKEVVVILNIGGVIETNSWKNKVDGILLAWQAGQEGGNSVADVFSGKINPSGKLPMTFPIDYHNHASAANWPGSPEDNPEVVDYAEGIYVGYRYFDTFEIEPSFEFGFGKSYTQFSYSDLDLGSSNFDGKLKVSVKITNSGKKAGKEVVQLYISAPAQNLDKPTLELKSFAKTALLKPGESEILKFTLKPRDLASFVETKNAWIAEEGKYVVKIGASSKDIRTKREFSLPAELVVEKVQKTFELDSDLKELRN